jgi:hypothetical protein
MKKAEVQINETYIAKVSGNLVPVKITGESLHGGWDAINTKTKKKIRIKSAQRLRSVHNTPSKDPAYQATKAERRAFDAAIETACEKASEPTPDDRPTRPNVDDVCQAFSDHAAQQKTMSLIDAAAHLLSLGSGDPMRCKDIVDLAVARNLWRPGKGKTPSNTLYSSILREIRIKGTASRFVRTERGKFALASKR